MSLTSTLKKNKLETAFKSAAEEVIYYLELKNQYYEKFFQMTKKFIQKAGANQWEGLDFFVENRERVLKIIQYFDNKISHVLEKLPTKVSADNASRERVREIMEERNEWGKHIVEQDLELLSKLEEVRNETIKELKKTQDLDSKISSYTNTTRR